MVTANCPLWAKHKRNDRRAPHFLLTLFNSQFDKVLEVVEVEYLNSQWDGELSFPVYMRLY